MSLEPQQNIQHVAIIMDGNGRWAEGRSHERIWGHVRGSSVVSNIVEEADDRGLKALTLYAFSTENWSRPSKEIKTLFKLLKKFLLKERKKIIDNRIRFKVIGEICELPQETIELIREIENTTKDFEGLKLTFAFGYGARNELVYAFNKLMEQKKGDPVTEADIQQALYQPDLGDVDLLIRTGGDQRISNFLLWQIAYAELFFTPTKWPEFTTKEFSSILDTVDKRERRFGSIESERDLKTSSEKAAINKNSIGNHFSGNSSHV